MRATQFREGVKIGALLIILIWLSSSIWGLAHKAFIAVSQAKETEMQYQQLEARKKELEATLAALATDRGRDAAIRTSFGVARPGEEVIVVVPPATTTPTPEPSWWDKVLRWFSLRD